MFQALLGPALSFGSSLLSGLGSRQSAKKQQKLQAAYEYQNYMQQQEDNRANRDFVIEYDARRAEIGNDLRDWSNVLRQWSAGSQIVHDATQAGFNPVTWVGAMGGMYQARDAYANALLSESAQYRTPSLWQQQSYMQNAPTAQVPSVLEAVGGAAQAGVNTLLSDWRAADSRNFQREMLSTQIAAIAANGGRPSSALGVPAAQRTFFGSGQIPFAAVTGANSPRAGFLTGGGGSKDPVATISPFVGDQVKVTAPFFESHGWLSTRNANAEAIGERYHEEGPIPWLYGNVYLPWQDIKYNARVYSQMPMEFMGTKITPLYPDGARGVTWGSATKWPTGPGEYNMPYTGGWF